MGPPGLTCAVSHGDGSVTLTVAGDVDLSTSPKLAVALEEAQASGDPVVLDLAKATHFDSSGVAALVEAIKRGPITITCAGGIVRRVLEVCGFGDLIAD